MPDSFGLYLVLTEPVTSYEACAEAAVAEGIRYVQLRMKDEPKSEVLKVAQAVREITLGTETLFIVNDDVSVAEAVDADGVHVGQQDMPLKEVRKAWNVPGKLFGLSTHTEEEEQVARSLEPDYIGIGPIFPTPTKAEPDPTVGLKQMEQIASRSPLTTVAIGGIDEGNLADVLAHGVSNFAVVRAVCASQEPREAIQRLMRIWREHA